MTYWYGMRTMGNRLTQKSRHAHAHPLNPPRHTLERRHHLINPKTHTSTRGRKSVCTWGPLTPRRPGVVACESSLLRIPRYANTPTRKRDTKPFWQEQFGGITGRMDGRRLYVSDVLETTRRSAYSVRFSRRIPSLSLSRISLPRYANR